MSKHSEMNYKFSIVIPAYNVAGFLPELLQNLLEQTYGNFEVIVVDDKATDDTAAVAESYLQAFRGKGIDYVVIHKPQNEGLSMARNTGISHATGDYILFLDGDDSVEKNLLETLADALSLQAADLVLYGYSEDYYRKNTLDYQVHKKPKEGFFTKADKSLSGAYPYIVELEHETMFGYAWNKAYRLAFLRDHHLAFQKITHIEDILFNIQVADCMESFLCLPKELYHYANRGQERLTDKYLPEYFPLQKTRIQKFCDMQKRKMALKEIPSWEESLYQTMAGVYFRSFQSALVRDIEHGIPKKETLLMAKKELEGDLYPLLSTYQKGGGKLSQILYAPLVRGDVETAYNRAKEVSWAKKHFSGLYAKLKQSR